MKLKFKKLHENAQTPKYATTGSAAFDLHSIEAMTLYPNQVTKIRTGLSVELPEGTYGAIAPRSGLASKGITVYNAPGIVDADYRGEVCVLLLNITEDRIKINVGDRIVQMLVLPYIKVEMEDTESLSETVRGTSGFGSSGN